MRTEFRPDGRGRNTVTFHAVTRYVQRVLHVIVDQAAPPLSPAEIADAHCCAAGTTIETVSTAILTPAVRAALALGVPFINTPDFNVVLREGRVITVRHPKRLIDHMQMRDRSESRRISHQHQRRRRRRPKAGAAS